ncbi:MAG TPA: dTDP-4-dehydrorhamnose reductase [Candidatus Binataceae bacterium]|nr:dTDP-4-dehydrorhamnose reductase [Candidatus Binataceae bacterium]
MKILIAGASGQLGKCLLRSLASHEPVALDHAALDVTRLDHVSAALDLHRPQLVINASAFNDVDGAELRADEAYAVNALGPRNLAVATAARRLALVHVSTDYVFDGTSDRPYHEFDRTNPLSVYGASKLAGEEAVRALNHRHYIVRTAWLFWENGKSFLLSMYRNLSRPELRVACDQYGSPTYVPHLAQAIARLIASEAFGTFHLAGSGAATRWDMVNELSRVAQVNTTVHPVSLRTFPAAAKRPAYSVLRTAQSPRIELPPWQEGVREFLLRAR